jgi:ribonuclease HII
MVVIGVDEVGRGCWAGPLVVGAVILDYPIIGLKDSKLLRKSKRTEFDKLIRLQAIDFGIGWVEPGEVDALGLTKATTIGVSRAIDQIKVSYDQIIIDGNINYLPDNHKAICLIKADNLIPSVSAASIIAKVARDNFMEAASSAYPEYGFDKHVGYGTAYHRAMLSEHGVSKIHRLSYKPVRLLMSSGIK